MIVSCSCCCLCISDVVVLVQIESVWVEQFSEEYAEGISTENLDHVMQQLVSQVKSQKLHAPGLPQSFREFMVRFLFVFFCVEELFLCEKLVVEMMSIESHLHHAKHMSSAVIVVDQCTSLSD